MNTETSYFMPPPRPIEESMREWAWEDFHRSILNKGDALDYVIDFVDSVCKGEYGKSIVSEYFESYKNKGDIKKMDLHSHYFKLILSNKDNLISNEEGTSKRNLWNMESNILRVLKRMKSGEPLCLLPKEDRDLTYKFIDKLKSPPRSDY